MSNFWNDQSSKDETFSDRPSDSDDFTQFPEQPAKIVRQAQAQPTHEQVAVEELIEEVVQEEEDNYEDTLADANLRIDQGTLYKMIMNANIFQDMDIDPRAVNVVQREMKKFAKNKMEEMLGMRQAVSKDTVVSSPFNDLEVSVLKKLASAATKGASETPSRQESKADSGPQPPPKRTSITPIGPQKTRPVAQPVQKPVQKSVPTKVINKPQPIQRQSKIPTTLEEAIKQEVADTYKGIGKSIEKMTEDELIQHNKDSALRQSVHKAAKNPSALPPPSVDQMNSLFAMRATDMASDPGLSKLVNLAKSKV